MPFMTRPRMQRIAGLYGEALVSAARARGEIDHHVDAHDLLRSFVEADPSLNKSATQWLVRCYLAESFGLEDLDKAHETLAAFIHFRHRLPTDERDIGRYRTLADLWKAVQPFILQQDTVAPKGRAARRREREQARAESIIPFEGDDGFTVAVPMTEFAAKWWGRGTRWCTAADRNNIFANYHADAPLVVILLPDGQKLQMHVSPDRCQFMDEDDGWVSLDLTEKWWPHLDAVLTWAVGRNGYLLKNIPHKFQTREICLAAVRHRGIALENVAPALRDREICLAAVKRGGSHGRHFSPLAFVPVHLRDREICETAIGRDGRALEDIPKKLVDRDMHLRAVTRTGTAIAQVPPDMADHEICVAAVSNLGYALKYVPLKFKNRDLCLAAVSRHGIALSFVPPQFRDLDMCLAAVRKCGFALDSVPKNLIDAPMCTEAVNQVGYALQFVPAKLRDAQTCLAAVRQDGVSLRFVPYSLKNDVDICAIAVEKHGLALQYVPVHLRDREMCVKALKTSTAAMSHVPQSLRADLIREFGIRPPERTWDIDLLDDLRAGLEASATLRDHMEHPSSARAQGFAPSP